MEAKHTQGPLKAVRNTAFWELVTPWPDETLEEANANSPTVAYAWGDTEEQAAANARQLAACWNACAGIPTDDLELCPDGGLLHIAAHSNRLVEQRDELLAAIVLLRQVREKQIQEMKR